MNTQFRQKLLVTVLAGGLGFFLNALNIEMFFGVNIIFGGILPMLIVLAYGSWYGAAAALIASSYTYFLWGHPYAMVIFTLEAVAVGFVASRSRRWALGSDLVFWLFVGMPLVYFFYHHVLSLSLTSTFLIALKQPTNALFNLSIAGALLLWKPLRSRLLRENFHLPSLSDYISSVLMLLIGLILFAQTAYEGRELNRELNGEIQSDLQEKARAIQQNLDQLLFTSRKGVVKVADFVPKLRKLKNNPARQEAETQALALSLREQYPLLNRFYLTDPQGRLLHNLLPRHAGDTTPGRQLLINDQTPRLLWTANGHQFAWASVQYDGRENIQLAIVETLYRPNGEIDCLAVGTVSPKALGQSLGTLNNLFSEAGTKVILTDPNDRIVFSSTHSPQVKFSLDTSNLESLSGGFAMKFPSGKKPAMVRWGESAMVYSASLAVLGGSLHLEQPLREYQAVMQNRINRILVGLLLLMSSFILITSLISAYLNLQMQRVMTYTDEVQLNVEDGIHIETQLSSPIREMDNLSGKIRHSALEIQRLLYLERVHSVELQDAMQKLKQMQTELELQTSQHARIEAFRDFVHTIGNLITPVRVKASNLIAERHMDNYLEQLLARMKLFQEHVERDDLTEYLQEEGKHDLERFIQGLGLLREIESTTLQELGTIENALGKVVESTTAQSRLEKELSLLEEVDLLMVIKAVLSIQEDNWKAKGIESKFTVESADGSKPPAEVSLKVEKVRLFNMIQNVLKNAGETFEDEAQANKRIDILLRMGPEDIVLEVADNGKGLTREELTNVGQIGFTTKWNTETGEGGSGLGIHNCKLFMARVSGRFELSSSGPGLGAKATMTFPKEMLL